MNANKRRGTAFETSIANYLAVELQDDRIERRAQSGAKDRGDIAGVRLNGHRVVIECKNQSRINLSGWLDEAQTEAGNDDAILGAVVFKRRGTAKPGEQYVLLTVDDLVTLLSGGVQ
ncbi:hypothetical protein [Microbacterium enclense]|uniref:hypothetical protein n=1 Tax=Microbacterium enclense TaxID=993073 RepID=UPI0034144437